MLGKVSETRRGIGFGRQLRRGPGIERAARGGHPGRAANGGNAKVPENKTLIVREAGRGSFGTPSEEGGYAKRHGLGEGQVTNATSATRKKLEAAPKDVPASSATGLGQINQILSPLLQGLAALAESNPEMHKMIQNCGDIPPKILALAKEKADGVQTESEADDDELMPQAKTSRKEVLAPSLEPTPQETLKNLTNLLGPPPWNFGVPPVPLVGVTTSHGGGTRRSDT
jgi:hypothetical protein